MRPGQPVVRPRVTVKEVAQLANVSTSTVSRVLNGKVESLSQQTQDRVLEAARKLDYYPNSVAAGLRKHRTNTVGLIIPDISDVYFHMLARGVEDAAQEAGYSLVLCNTDRIPDKEIRYLDVLREKQVEGIIFAGGGINGDEHLQSRNWGAAKVVTVGPHQLPFPAVDVDNRADMAGVVRHLAQQGCRSIACLAGQPNWLISQVRLGGFQEGLISAGIAYDEQLIWPTDFTIEGGRAAIRQALVRALRFDGLVAFNDNSALGALEVLREGGVRVPGDVAAVGCDDIPVSALFQPSLSSVSFPLHQLGRTAMKILLDLVQDIPVDDSTLLPSSLVIRASSNRQLAVGEQ